MYCVWLWGEMLGVLVYVLFPVCVFLVIAVTRPHVGIPGACHKFNDLEAPSKYRKGN